MSNLTNDKCPRCNNQLQGQLCPFCTITGLDVHALLASESLTLPTSEGSSQMPLRLVDIVSGREFPVTSPVCKIGRDLGNDIIITGDKSLSRFHFQITCKDSQYYVEDTGSRNGTFVNGSPVTTSRKITDGDIISAGMARYCFLSEISVEPAETIETPIDTAFLSEAIQESAPDTTTLNNHFLFQQASLDTLASLSPNLAVVASPDLSPANAAAVEKEKSQEQQLEILGNGNNEPETAISKGHPDHRLLISEEVSKMEIGKSDSKMLSQRSWPSWCNEFLFSETKGLNEQINQLNEQIRLNQEKIRELESSVSQAEYFAHYLLAAEGNELVEACAKVMRLLGWTADVADTGQQELIIKTEGETIAIVRIVLVSSQPQSSDLAQLVNAQTNYWCKHNIEPKGILLIATTSDHPPSGKVNLNKELIDYATKKNLCLMTTLQLLCMYKDLTFANADTLSFKTTILNASGQLPNFVLEHKQTSLVTSA